MRISRRDFLGGLGLVGAAVAASRLRLGRAFAAADDYRALVCVFLFGGNDGNNLIVPVDDRYAAYAAARGPLDAGGLALAKETLVELAPDDGGAAAYGLHPALADLQPLWTAGALAPVFNVGTLLAPTTKDDFLSAKVPQPLSLLSHQDQQHQWQTAISNQSSNTGWGGRLADTLTPGELPPIISISGNQLFTAGLSTSPLALPPAGAGAFGLAGFDNSPEANARRAAFDHIRMAEDASSIVQATAAQVSASLAAGQKVAPILAGAGSTVDAVFAGQTSGIALQLLQVARLIEARGTLGSSRQIFFVSQGGYDTHNDEIARQGDLLAELGPALKAFYDATAALGVNGQVTTFTLSDFARTLSPASGGGSDHAWGNHHLVIGGAVKGRQTYGTFPVHSLGGPDDFSTEGRWVPTTAVDQYAATLATWFGVDPSALPSVLPNIARFPTANLGFLG